MAQPEAKFKRKLIESFERFIPGAWYTYLSHGGAGQKPGLNDLLFGVRNGGPARPLLYVEAKMWPIAFKSTQIPTLSTLQACGAVVRIVALHPCAEHPRRVMIHPKVFADGPSLPVQMHMDYKTVSFWDFLWSFGR